jgi:hypothetical protein
VSQAVISQIEGVFVMPSLKADIVAQCEIVGGPAGDFLSALDHFQSAVIV